jgi:hypothetical protein
MTSAVCPLGTSDSDIRSGLTSAERIADKGVAMNSLSRALARLTLVVVSLASAAGAFAQSYGLGDQVLSLGHAAFRPVQSDIVFHLAADGYLYGAAGAGYAAGVVLPDGAVITQICVYANVSDAAQDVSASLDRSRLLAGGQGPPLWGSVGSADDNVPVGYGVVCSDLAYEVHGQEDGFNIALDVFVNAHGTSGFGGARLTWHRQVSQPPESPTFADVQPGDFGFPQIEALAASGITGGCGNGNYCPNGTLTRAQMAIFLAKALGLHWVN